MLIYDEGQEKLIQNKMEFSPPRLPKHFVTVLGEDKVFPNWNNDYDILLSFLTLYQSKCCLGRVWICRRKMRPCLMIWVVVKRGRQEKLLGNVTRIPTCLLQREKSSYCTFLQLGQYYQPSLIHLETHWSFLKMASDIFGTLFSLVSVSIKFCWSSSAIVREESEFYWPLHNRWSPGSSDFRPLM